MLLRRLRLFDSIEVRLGAQKKRAAGNRGGRHASRVLADVRSGRRSGVTRTPTFFFNDAWLENDDRLEDMIGQAA